MSYKFNDCREFTNEDTMKRLFLLADPKLTLTRGFPKKQPKKKPFHKDVRQIVKRKVKANYVNVSGKVEKKKFGKDIRRK